MSPELMLRPSLSGALKEGRQWRKGGVAGAYAPAFVERYRALVGSVMAGSRVAGAYAPAFVERC